MEEERVEVQMANYSPAWRAHAAAAPALCARGGLGRGWGRGCTVPRPPGQLAQPVQKRWMNQNRWAGTNSSSHKKKKKKEITIIKKGKEIGCPPSQPHKPIWTCERGQLPEPVGDALRQLLTLLPLPHGLRGTRNKKNRKKAWDG